MNKKIKFLIIIIFFIGVIILFYPLVSQYWNSKVQSKAIENYDEVLNKVKDYTNLFEKGNDYNEDLFDLEFPLIQYKKLNNYNDLFNINNDGMIGYISIQKIKIELPIYHGTSSSVLNVAVGHLEGTSLPIGGNSTHSVLSAHRGLPSSKLFTNLNKLEIGDTFIITVLNKKLTYQVDKITTVEPKDITDLEIEEDKDLVTLLTCTPYGVNTHRLLVRGIRVDNIENQELIITSEAYQIDKITVTIIICIPILFLLVMYIILKPVKKVYKEEGI